ncbi:MAG: phytanoyl-CoA dioxygenase family protein [Burkholderiales bacterium]|nr:phytanoyl-CoA dioxygenase family protein [Burkholderiales bacterium]
MNNSPLHAVSEQDAADYHRDGAVCLRGMFDADWIERMTRAVDRILDDPGPRAREATRAGRSGRFHVNSFLWRWDPDFRALALDSPMIGIAAGLLGAQSVAFFYDQLFVKEPGTAEITHWHQDLPFWPMQGNDILSIWLALTPVTAASSGVQYVAGSHRWGKFYRAVTPDEDPRFTNTALEPCPDFFDATIRAEHRFLTWDMQPGDVLCHHPLAVHGASGNASSTQRRIGTSLRYTGDDARWDPRQFVMRVEGEPEKGLRPGDRPVLEGVFPLVWRHGGPSA